MAALLACSMLAACGGSGDAPLTVHQLAQKGSTICVRAEGEESAMQITSVTALRAALPRLNQIGDRQVAELAALKPPASEKASYEDLVRTATELNDALKPLYAAVVHGQKAPQQTLARARELTAHLAKVDHELGMGVCSLASVPGS